MVSGLSAALDITKPECVHLGWTINFNPNDARYSMVENRMVFQSGRNDVFAICLVISSSSLYNGIITFWSTWNEENTIWKSMENGTIYSRDSRSLLAIVHEHEGSMDFKSGLHSFRHFISFQVEGNCWWHYQNISYYKTLFLVVGK